MPPCILAHGLVGSLDFSQEEPLCRVQPAQLSKADLPRPMHEMHPHTCVYDLLRAAWYHFHQILKGVCDFRKGEGSRNSGVCVWGWAGGWGDTAVQTPGAGMLSLLPVETSQSRVRAPSGQHSRITDTGVSRHLGTWVCTPARSNGKEDRWNPAVAPASCQLSLAARRALCSWLSGSAWVCGHQEPTKKR